MIPLDYYRMFYYVAQYRSFTRAAKYLNNSQPNLTRCMNILENELGCALFIRSNRGVALTPEGDKLYHYVSVGYEQILTGEQKIRKTKDMEEGMITIGVSDIALHLILLDHLEEFHEMYPSIRLQILSDSAPAAIDSLRNHLVDFSVVTTHINIKKPLTKTSLRNFQEILIGGTKYDSYARRTNTLRELRHLPFISLDKRTSTRQLHEQFFHEHHLPFHPDMEAATTDQVLPMIQRNLGIGFYPKELTARAFERQEIVELPLQEKIPGREICLLQNTSHSLSVAARQFIDILKGTARTENGNS